MATLPSTTLVINCVGCVIDPIDTSPESEAQTVQAAENAIRRGFTLARLASAPGAPDHVVNACGPATRSVPLNANPSTASNDDAAREEFEQRNAGKQISALISRSGFYQGQLLAASRAIGAASDRLLFLVNRMMPGSVVGVSDLRDLVCDLRGIRDATAHAAKL